MKILIPTAKQLNADITMLEKVSPCLQQTHQIIDKMAELSVASLQHLYQSSDDVSTQAHAQWQLLQSKEAVGTQAIALFDGLMYRHMQREKWTDADKIYVNQHVRITSALYGVITPDMIIAPYRLDFQQKLLFENGETLMKLWRDQYDASVAHEDVVLSLLSSEFEQVFSPRVRERFIRVTFMENGKIHATISKKARGAFVDAMIHAHVKDVAGIKKLEVAGFCYNETTSTEKHLVFEKMT